MAPDRRSLLDGPPLALPAWADRLSEGWARRPPRTRALIVCLALAAMLVLPSVRLGAARAAWGDSRAVLIATRPVPAGGDLRGALSRVQLPVAALPVDPVSERPPRGAVLALPLVEGAVLTQAHLSARGPAAGIAADQRLVPIPVERSWGVEAGSVVDVWAAPADGGVPDPIATARPVVAVSQDRTRTVALVAVHVDDVAAATAGLSRGGVLLTLGGSG